MNIKLLIDPMTVHYVVTTHNWWHKNEIERWLSQVEFKLAYGPGSKQILMTP